MPLFHIPKGPEARPILGLKGPGHVLRPGDDAIELDASVAAQYRKAGLVEFGNPRNAAADIGELKRLLGERDQALTKALRQRDIAVADVARLKDELVAARRERDEANERLGRAELDLAERDTLAAQLRAELDDAVDQSRELAERDALIQQLRDEIARRDEERARAAAANAGDVTKSKVKPK